MSKRKSPDFKQCMRMMRDRDPEIQEDGFHFLLADADKHIDELLGQFDVEKDLSLKSWLLELIGEARSEKALDILCNVLDGPDPTLREWAIIGLKSLNTKAARKRLFEAGVKKR